MHIKWRILPYRLNVNIFLLYFPFQGSAFMSLFVDFGFEFTHDIKYLLLC